MIDGLKIEVKEYDNHFNVLMKDNPEEVYADFLLKDAIQGWVSLYGEKYGVTDRKFTIVLPWAEQEQ